MQLTSWRWLPWDQTRAVDNARSAHAALLEVRVEREEIDSYIQAVLSRRRAVSFDRVVR